MTWFCSSNNLLLLNSSAGKFHMLGFIFSHDISTVSHLWKHMVFPSSNSWQFSNVCERFLILNGNWMQLFVITSGGRQSLPARSHFQPGWSPGLARPASKQYKQVKNKGKKTHSGNGVQPMFSRGETQQEQRLLSGYCELRHPQLQLILRKYNWGICSYD